MFNEREIPESEELPLTEKVVRISRVAKVVKGGRHLSFNAMVVVGDGDGHVGIGMGKADAIPDAVRKGTAEARKTLKIMLGFLRSQQEGSRLIDISG